MMYSKTKWIKPFHNFFEKLNKLPKILALLFIRSYQITLSPMLGGACRFRPTCSCYGTEAFDKYDFNTAFRLTLFRVLKCRPFGPSGFDPVPEKEAAK